MDSAHNLGPLISRWEISKFENCSYKSVRILEVLKLLFQQFLNFSSSQRDVSGPILADLSNNRWLEDNDLTLHKTGGSTFQKKILKKWRTHQYSELRKKSDLKRKKEQYINDNKRQRIPWKRCPCWRTSRRRRSRCQRFERCRSERCRGRWWRPRPWSGGRSSTGRSRAGRRRPAQSPRRRSSRPRWLAGNSTPTSAC